MADVVGEKCYELIQQASVAWSCGVCSGLLLKNFLSQIKKIFLNSNKKFRPSTKEVSVRGFLRRHDSIYAAEVYHLY